MKIISQESSRQNNNLGGFTPIIDDTGKITGYKTSVGGADTVFPFKSNPTGAKILKTGNGISALGSPFYTATKDMIVLATFCCSSNVVARIATDGTTIYHNSSTSNGGVSIIRMVDLKEGERISIVMDSYQGTWTGTAGVWELLYD